MWPWARCRPPAPAAQHGRRPPLCTSRVHGGGSDLSAAQPGRPGLGPARDLGFSLGVVMGAWDHGGRAASQGRDRFVTPSTLVVPRRAALGFLGPLWYPSLSSTLRSTCPYSFFIHLLNKTLPILSLSSNSIVPCSGNHGQNSFTVLKSDKLSTSTPPLHKKCLKNF